MPALTFPLTLAQFFDRLPVAEVPVLVCAAQRQLTGLESGEILSAERAAPLWQGEIRLRPMRSRAAAEIAALLALLENNHGAFLARPAQQFGAASDPAGAALGASVPAIDTLDPDSRRLKLSGLPAGYELTPGDFLSFAYSGTRRAFHQVVQGGAADGLGVTSLLEVTPQIRPGASAGAVVDLVKPTCRAVLVPGTVDYGARRGNITAGMGFAWRQTMRG